MHWTAGTVAVEPNLDVSGTRLSPVKPQKCPLEGANIAWCVHIVIIIIMIYCCNNDNNNNNIIIIIIIKIINNNDNNNK